MSEPCEAGRMVTHCKEACPPLWSGSLDKCPMCGSSSVIVRYVRSAETHDSERFDDRRGPRRVESVRGEVIQLIEPEDASNYSVGRAAELFASHGWHIAVVDDVDAPRTVTDRLRSWAPWTAPSHITDLIVLDPSFEEGDYVSLSCELFDERFHIHPSNPLNGGFDR